MAKKKQKDDELENEKVANENGILSDAESSPSEGTDSADDLEDNSDEDESGTEEEPKQMTRNEISHAKIEDLAPLVQGEDSNEKVANENKISHIHVGLLREFVARKEKNKLVLSDGNHELIDTLHKKLTDSGRI